MHIEAADIENLEIHDVKKRRIIRSYVLRQGRVTPAQKRAFSEQWQHFGIEYSGQIKNFDSVFARAAERVLEIGFGNGEQMHFAAINEPTRDFIGVEVHGPGVGRLLNALADDNLKNGRVYQHDAVEVLKNEIVDGSLSEVRIYFPDPWHKKRHHKRRMIQTDFVQLLCQKIKTGGLLHLATDWENYAEHMWDVCDAEPQLENKNGPRGFASRPDWRRQTHFETRGL
ncbi:MAG: tRNA (guanosine(46)-N7)-methyltransferase TrmB, partial [Arenimonas sp.]